MADSRTPLEYEGIYHIYNHAVGSELLFYNSLNYLHFLNLFKIYIVDYVNVYAYCLMPNHFHIVLQVKSLKEFLTFFPSRISSSHKAVNISKIISIQLGHLFNAYAQAINKQQNRKGSLFNNRFKRKPIADDIYLQKLIHYIHFNPVEAGLSKDIADWPFSSYNAIISSKLTLIVREQVIKLFDSIENFVFYHNHEPVLSEVDL